MQKKSPYRPPISLYLSTRMGHPARKNSYYKSFPTLPAALKYMNRHTGGYFRGCWEAAHLLRSGETILYISFIKSHKHSI